MAPLICFPPYFMRQYFRAKRWYWFFQLLGWAAFWGTQVQAAFMLKRYEPGTLLWLTTGAVFGLLLTHGYRALLLRYGVLRLPLAWQAAVAMLGLLGLSLTMQLLWPVIYMLLEGRWQWKWPYTSGVADFAFGAIGIGRYLIVWVLAYHFFVVGEWLAQAQVRELQAAAARRQAELDLLRSQINPHFLFNALNSVRALTLSDPHRARTAVTQLADLLRYTLNYEQRQLIPLGEELAAVQDYLALEQTRFGPERLRLDLQVPEALLAWPVPPAALLTLQSQVFIKDGEACHFVRLADIDMFEAVGNYVRVYFGAQSPLHHKSLQQLEDKLPPDLFFRVNRQQILNLTTIERVHAYYKGGLLLEVRGGRRIDVSTRQAVRFKELLSL